ncbi:MAG TPA: ribonuclease P protein component [Acidobacteriota bacterium]|jgi:ribonuclease P protein component|nr:ribonuclease P protein component [Acidobacteriota bacterium]HNT17484.1 ribonuclease P protein component [Acidobacteriota bacterium]HPA27766.1 ribonuclease P protein component [Acidobacteriota bacterium]HQO20509.1 ribonuclease P protein component [Acidobacteriota bacterium]HQQ46734.1 ribonuclease P protein component [Acidobacteriota bacterium]
MAPHALKTPRTGTFAKTDRLRKRREFLSVYEIKRSYFFRLFVVYVRENGLGRHRLGLTVSKKVGGSVVRNRVKRVLREAFRRQRALIAGSFDIVVNAKKGSAEMRTPEAAESFALLAEKLSQ